MQCKIVDWAGNETYPGKTFDSEIDAWDFLMDDQHKRHPDATEKEFNDVMGEFETEEALPWQTTAKPAESNLKRDK